MLRSQYSKVALVVLVALIGASGCTMQYRVRDDLKLKDMPAQKIPLRLGLVLHQSILNDRLGTGSVFHEVLIGEGFNRGAEMAFRAVFKDVAIVEANATMLGETIDVVASGIITERAIRVIEGGRRLCTVSAKWTIADRKGRSVYANTILGEGITDDVLKQHFSDCMTSAMEDHYNKLVAHLIGVDWWRDVKEEAKREGE